MKISEIESSVLNRVECRNWTLDPYKDFTLLTEEIGELGREIRRYEDGRQRPDEMDIPKDIIKKEISTEIGDILFPLIKIAHYYGITLEDAFKSHLSKMDDRYNK